MSERTIKLAKNIASGRTAYAGWLLVGLYIILAGAGLILLFQPEMPQTPIYREWEAVLQSMGLLVMAVMGALIVSRHPLHPIGWLFIAAPLLLGIDLFAFGYAAFGLVANPGALPGTLVMAEVGDELAFSTQFGLILVLMLFPDGRFLSRRWRMAAWFMGIATVCANLIWFLNPGPLFELPSINNPFGVSQTTYAVLRPLAAVISDVLIPLFLVAGAFALLLRFRRGSQMERQQIKWFVFGTAPFVIGAVIQLVFQLNTSFGYLAFITVGLVTLPVATAVAIFRYRLYDIDLIINRTLVYAALTVSIVLFYIVTISATSYFLQTNSNLAALLITGAIVAFVFRPLYAVLQRGVDEIMYANHPPPSPPPQERIIPTGASLSVNWLPGARIAWVVLVVAALALLVASLPGYASMFGGQLGFAPHTVLPPGSRFFAAAAGIASLVSALLSLGLSALLFRQKFTEFIAALLSFFFLLYGVLLGGPLEFAANYWLGSTAFVATVQGLLLSTPFIALLLLFPNGRFVPSWTRWVLLLSVLWSIGLFWVAPFDIESFSRSPLLASAVAVLFVAFGLVGIYAQFFRYRRAATYNERQQIRWAVYGFALWIAYILFSSIPYYYLTSLPPGGPMPWWGPASVMGWFLSLNILPVCLTIAITRYQLWNIDLVVNRTLVYAALTASVALFYGAIVSTAGYFLQTDNHLAGLLLTALVVIIVFRPLRANVQQAVDRVVGSATRVGSVSATTVESEAAKPEVMEDVGERPYHTYLPLLALVILLVGNGLAFVGLHLVTPFANGRLQPGTYSITARGVIIAPLEAGPAGLQSGDVVAAVNGRSLEAWLQNPGRIGQIDDTISLTVLNAGEQTPVDVTLSRYPLGTVLRREWGALVFRLSYLLVALYIFVRRPHVPAARILLLAAAAQFSAIPWSIGAQVGDFVNGIGLWLYFLGVIGGFMLAWVAALHFALIFPRPLPILKRRRWLLPLLYGLPFLALALYLWGTRTQTMNTLDWLGRWEWFTGPQAALYLSLTFVALVWQYRRHRHGPARQQMRWLGLGGLIVAGAAVLFYFLPLVIGDSPLDVNIMGLIGLLFPLTIAVAILRHNLFDIDTLLNRALVYGGLTAVIITLYVLVVGVLGTVLQAQGNLFVALVATGLAAILFQPLRDRLQKTVNRFMYGERDEPFEVLARLGQRLESTLSPEMVYPTVVETVSQALKLPYTAVAVWQEGRLETVESYGKPVADPVTYPLTYQGEQVGQLLVARRAPDEPFSPADKRILRNIARQAGAAVHAVQLMADLQQSRQRLVTAREEERRRLRRDLHDGLGPRLAAHMLKIGSARALLSQDPAAVQRLLAQLEDETEVTLAEVRRLVYDLRPPVLDQLGLVGAIRACAEDFTRDGRTDLTIAVDVPEPLPDLPAAVEVAAYHIAREGLTNVVRHAQASRCRVRLACKQSLTLAIEDDGVGLPDGYRAGVGLSSMQERAAELGGVCRLAPGPEKGTVVSVTLPLEV